MSGNILTLSLLKQTSPKTINAKRIEKIKVGRLIDNLAKFMITPLSAARRRAEAAKKPPGARASMRFAHLLI
jgi:hypothetical protein